jgi:uncharacterized membrane protein
MQNQKSALGLDANITALLGYIIGIVALVLIFIEKDNKFVRFHAFQSVFLVVTYIACIIGLMILGAIVFGISMASSTLGSILGLLMMLLWFAIVFGFLGAIIFCAIKAYGGTQFKLPVIGNLAEKYA